MKQLMPSAVVQAATASDISTANAAKSGYKGAETVLSGGLSADPSSARASFLDSLENLVAAGGAATGVSGLETGGKTLPLADPAAITGLIHALDGSADGDLQSPTMVGALPAAPQGAQQDAAVPAGAATLAELSQLIARTPPRQAVAAAPGAVSQPIVSPDTADDKAITTPADAVQHRAGIAIAADAAIARMQQGLSNMPSNPNGAIRESVTRTGSVDARGNSGAADLQPQGLKAAAYLNESDQLFTSRIQLATLNQAAELGAQKQVLENLANTTQANTGDALHATLSRAQIPQTVMTTESQSASAQATITETVGRPEWNQGMGKQILWMVNQNISRAEIRLNPANLGPLEVRVDMENDQVNVAFTSRHAEVREAVEQALPRLREMLEDKGLNLADADVSHHSFAEQQQAFAHADGSGSDVKPGFSYADETAQSGEDGVTGVPVTSQDSVQGQGLVDYYI